MKILLYKDFSDSKTVVEAECGKKIADSVPVTDWSRHVVLVNGIKSDENHVLKENDLVIIRSVPRGSDNPVVSTVLTIATGGIYAGYQAYQAKKEAEKIQDEIDKLKSHTNDGITNVPYIKGANNAIASGKSQPYVIGRHLLTPYVLNSSKSAAKGFHTIGGAYGSGTYYNVVLGCGFGKQIIDSLSTDDVKAAALSSDSPQENTEEFPKYFFNKGSAFASDESFVEISQDGNNFSNPIFNRKIVETSPNAQLKKSDAEDYEDLYFTLEKNARACSVCILFNGLYQQNDKGERSSREITIIPEYSIDYARRLALNDSPEEAGWIPFTFTQKSTATRKVLHTGSYRFDFDGPVNYGTTDYSRPIKKRKSEWILKSGEDCKDHPGVTYDFYYETEGHAVLGADIICSYYEEVEESVPATDSNTFSYNKNTQLRFEAYTPFSFSEATRLRVSGGKLVYEPRDYPITLRLRCTTSKVKSGSEVSDCYVEYVQSYCYDVEKSLKARRLIDERILGEKEASRSTLLGVHVKATASNEDKLGKINIVTNGLAPVCEYDSARHRWVWDLSEKVPTSNPASWLLEVLMSDTHPASKFRSEELDLDSFAELYGYCEEKGLSVNLVLAQPQKKSSVLDSILSVCHAALYQNIYGQCAVAIDCVKENAIAVLNEQNMISFSWEKQIALNVDGVRVTYIDEASDWQENSFVRMYKPDAEIGENSVIREIRADGITNFVQAQKHAHYIMACDKLRPTKARAVVGREGIYYLPYEKVLVQHPSLKVGLGNAVIQSVIVNASDEIIGFDLYDSVTLSPQENYSIVIQCVSDTYCTPLTLAIVSPEGTEENQQKTIWLAAPLPLDSAVIPHAGDIMSYGYSRDLSTVTKEFVIAAIEPSGNAGYILTLVDYNAGIFDVDESTIPEYSPVITQPHSFVNEIPAEVPEKHPTYEDLQKVENKYRVFQFALSSSNDEYPEDDDDWQESQPESSDGQFVWMRSRWADESDDWSYSVITGPQGEPGAPGGAGKDGKDATQYYIHFVYCDDTTAGTNYSTSEARKYIGVYTDTTQADAATFNAAKAKAGIVWSKAEGEDGTNGTTPTVTATKSNGKTTIIINGTAAATINDGTNGASLVNKGNWAASTKYNVLDCVYVAANKTSYVCKTAHTSGTSFSATNWTVLAAQGNTGAAGPQGPQGPQGNTGPTGNFTKRIPLYYVSTSTTAPAKPTARITATGAATTTTWTQGKYTSFAVGKYYYTCEQIETYNSAGTFQSQSWSAVTRDTEYENAGTAKLRAAGKYIGKLTAAGTANGYTASSNWDWFLATSAITINNFGKAGTSGATVAGNVYVWNGSYWAKDSDTSHLAAAMNDMMSVADTYTTNATSVGAFATAFAKTIAAKSAFINQLFAETIHLQTNGIIKGGSRYKDDGTLDSNHWAEKGFFLRADGTLKARMESEINDSIIIGTKSGPGVGNGIRGVFIGTEAGWAAGGFDVIAIGFNASKNSNSGYSIAIGTEALMNGGGNNVAIGYRALKNFNSSSHCNVAIGYEAGGDTGSGKFNIFIGDSARSTESQNNVIIGRNASLSSKAQTDVLVAGNILLGRDALLKTPTSSDPATGNILIGDAVYINSNSQKAVDNIIIGKSKTLPQEGNAQIPFSNTININDIIKYLPSNFKLNKQLSIANGVPALILPKNVFCKNNSSLNDTSFARLDGVVAFSFEEWGGYIKYSNGLLIQWGKTTSSSGKASVSFRAYSSRESYAIFVAEGVQNCETRTTQDDTNGYDYGAGIDQKYESSCIFTCQSNRNIFYLAIGY